MNKYIVLWIVVSVAVSGCATHGTGAQYSPVVDLKGVDNGKYFQDLHECQVYARGSMNAGEGAAAGALGGAMFGAALLAIVGGDSSDIWRGAGAGALGGGVSGAATGELGQREIIKNCLRGRGYRVLN